MNREIRQRLKWVLLYEETGNAGLTCRRCGISRPTLRKWLRRYHQQGIKGLESQSRRPQTSPKTKVGDKESSLILKLRKNRNLCARRIQSELSRLHNINLGVATIHKVLVKNDAKPLLKIKRKKDFIRYERPTLGDRVQMDTS